MKRNYKSIIKKQPWLMVVFCLGVFTSVEVFSQIDPSGTVFFQNQYLFNPAKAGIDENLKVNIAYRKKARDLGAGINSQYATAEYGFSNLGLGISIFRQERGLIQATRFLATSAYHMDLAENQKLSFGLSLGIEDEGIDQSELKGDIDDPIVTEFNDTQIQLDGDFGLSYTIGDLNVQASGLHFTSLLLSNDETVTTSLRQPMVFGSVSYKFLLNGSGVGRGAIYMTPKVAYRKVLEFKEVIDIGAQISFIDDKVFVFTMYHSSKNATLGLGAKIKDLIGLSAMYTSQAKDYNGLAGSDFEFAMQFMLN